MRSGGEAQLPKLLALAGAVPPHPLTQEEAIAEARVQFLGRPAEFARLEPIFRNAGVERRYCAKPLDWFRQNRDAPERASAYLTAADALFREAARKAIAESGLAPEDIHTVITISSTGIATPSLDARNLSALGLRENVRRIPVFGIGCAGGVTGLSLAARIASANDGAPVLLVAVELCTLAFRLGRISVKDIVASALFGDGAAAAIVCAREEPGLLTLGESGEHTWPDTLDIMGWSVDPLGLAVVLARSVPEFALQNILPAAQSFLAGQSLALSDIRHFLFHPGSSKVIEAVEQALSLPVGTLQRERDTLRDFGNMSSPTALFVLRRAIDEGLKGPALLSALGPGFSSSFLLCDF